MNWIKYLFVLFLLLQFNADLKAQEIQNQSENLLLSQENLLLQSNKDSKKEISFYYDKIVGNLSSQLDGDQLLENLTRQIWNESSFDWENDSLYEYSYNGNDLVDTFIVHKWSNGGGWGNKYKETYSYDGNDRISFSNEWYWEGYWREYYRYYYDYYGLGNLAHLKIYTSTGSDWLYIGKYSYNWNSLNDTTRITLEGLDIFHGVWRYFWKVEFSYDSLNSLIKKDKFDYYSLNNWRPELRDLYFYDNNRNNSESIRQEWNSTDSTWINDYQYLYEYDLNNVLLSTVYQDWQTDSLDWENVWRETYTYTPQNNISTMFKETWTPETGWNNYVFRTYSYNTNNNWTEKLTQLWNGSDWKNYYRHLATWMEPVAVQEKIPVSDAFYLYQNYPNPFNPFTKIKFTIPQTDNPLLGGARGGLVTLKVYDILGNEIAILVNEEKMPGTYEVEFNGEGLPSGIYFYTLRAGNFSETKKMILLK